LESNNQSYDIISISSDSQGEIIASHTTVKNKYNFFLKTTEPECESDNFLIPIGKKTSSLIQSLRVIDTVLGNQDKTIEAKVDTTKDIQKLEEYIFDGYTLNIQKTQKGKMSCFLFKEKKQYKSEGYDFDSTIVNLLSSLPEETHNFAKTIYQKTFLPTTANYCEEAHKIADKSISFLNTHPKLLNILTKPFKTREDQKTIRIAGIEFPKGIFGIPSGFDKNATMINSLREIYGAGHVEIGTIIYDPYEGNPLKPTRLVRYSSKKAAGNNFGLPSLGAEKIMKNFEEGKRFNGGNYQIPVGAAVAVNPGIKDFDSKQDNLQKTLQIISPHKLSWLAYSACPNVLIESERSVAMEEYKKMISYFAKTAKSLDKKTPLALKLSPDLSKNELKSILKIVESSGYNIIIATNSSRTIPAYIGNGYSITGAPLFEKSLQTIKTIREINKDITIIACGGIDNEYKVAKMIDAGANIFQSYTGLIYNPFVLKELHARNNPSFR
jgi:dihydroorotate dehydrogenase